jgi:DNA processing protein
MASEQGRDVFAMPGSIHSPLAKGCHQLIKQGAKLVDSAQDILDELQFPAMRNAAVNRPMDAGPALIADDWLLAALGYDPVHIEILVERTGRDIATLTGQLLERELDGFLESLPGGIFRRLK